MTDLKSTIPAAAVTQITIRESISAGISDFEKSEQELAAAAHVRAAEIIAKIPELIQNATKDGLRRKFRKPTFRVELMPIGIDDTAEYLHTQARDVLSGTLVISRSLKHAARLVFDHCEAVGLNVYVGRDKLDEGDYVTYSLNISWSLPDDEQATKRRPLWLAWRT